jgi:hypothetical protein
MPFDSTLDPKQDQDPKLRTNPDKYVRIQDTVNKRTEYRYFYNENIPPPRRGGNVCQCNWAGGIIKKGEEKEAEFVKERKKERGRQHKMEGK